MIKLAKNITIASMDTINLLVDSGAIKEKENGDILANKQGIYVVPKKINNTQKKEYKNERN